ncbi:CRISPR-associated endoribonuclease Cas6 [Acidianus brierleyi]|uniref:CRISPR-associated endoribonuclease n=1 Tax=Acidianus brierleyi TaxID=41673 RepID=A0A2U9IHJ9_9CREN|nr:CRISPR-associated endoribonuclease Cas6 [Acidianus brierleyi]
MRIYIKARILEGYVPLHYNYYLQSFFYKSLPSKMREVLHDQGIEQGPRRFKMFTFSRLYGDFEKKEDKLFYKDYVYFAFSSALELPIKYLYESLKNDPTFVIGKAKFIVDKILVKDSLVELNDYDIFYTLSPVVATKKMENESKFYFPHQLEFNYLLQLNAKRKVLALTGKTLKSDLNIRVERWRRIVVKYKRGNIEGVIGKFKLKGPLTVLKIIYEAGLGAKNSQGFGMLEFEGTSIRNILGE